VGQPASPAAVTVHPLAGKPVPVDQLIDVARLEQEYYERRPTRTIRASRSASGRAVTAARPPTGRSPRRTSSPSPGDLRLPPRRGDRRAALHGQGYPRALGARPADRAGGACRERRRDIHPARRRLHTDPSISHAILGYNRGRERSLADGIVITPSHNPPEDGGFKYNPPEGGPAGTDVTGKIQDRARTSCCAAAIER